MFFKALLPFVLVFAGTFAPSDSFVASDPPSAVTYYVSSGGSDANSGTKPGRPWKSLAKLQQQKLNPGDKVLFERGSKFTSLLTVNYPGIKNNVVSYGSYGKGDLPVFAKQCVRVDASYVSFSFLKFNNCADTGLNIYGDYITVSKSVFSKNVAGVQVRPSTTGAVVQNNRFVDNNKMAAGTPGPDDDYGANGVVVWGQNTTVSNNFFKGHIALSDDYVQDGAAVEIYGAVNTLVKDNVAKNNLTFTELGSDVPNKLYTDATTYTGNKVTSTLADSQFLITRGAGNFGPVYNTAASFNTVVLVGNKSPIGIYCAPECSPKTLVVKNNVVVAAGPAQVEGSFSSASNRWCGQFHDLYTPSSTDVVKTLKTANANVNDVLQLCKK